VKILLVHNRYKQPGGEDTVFENERALLQAGGHEVKSYVRTNDELDLIGRLQAAKETVWSGRTYGEVLALIDAFRPDVVHCHNTFPLVSPSVYFAANARGVPVVQTLHNFRLACLNAMLYREDSVCTDCVGRLPWRGVVRGCYQDAVPQSAVVGFTLVLHRALRTYGTRVATYIALTESAKAMFVQAGLPSERIRVKPNFTQAIDAPTYRNGRDGLLFVGRLSREKGIETLARVAQRLPQVRIRVVGDGPHAERLRGLANVELLGRLERTRVLALMHESQCLIVPSISPETFGMVVAEAFACGLPVIASRVGALVELIDDGRTGMLCAAGSDTAFANAITSLLGSPEQLKSMSVAAHAYSRQPLGPDRNLRMLEEIYRGCQAEKFGALNHA
jgi:glycosyltransferase involved in cell wall biosynthesis